jgi:hypothetical protein
MYRPSILLVFGTVLMLHQPYTVAAKKNEAKKSHGDLAQDAELVNGNPWALLIDAGSGGSRMHLYEWEPRVYHTLPPPIAKPFTSEVRVCRLDAVHLTRNKLKILHVSRVHEYFYYS